MLGIMRNGLMRSPFVVGMVIGSMAFGVFPRRAEGRSAAAAEPPVVVITQARIPDFDAEEATRQVLSLGFGLEYRPARMGLALEGPPEQGVLDPIVVDESSPGVPVGVGTFLNPHVFLLPGLGSGFELPGMDEAASDAARQAGLTIRFSIMAGLVVTPLWTGAVCAFAATVDTPDPTTGGRVVATLIQPLGIGGDLAEAICLADRFAEFYNDGLRDGAWDVPPGLTPSQQQGYANCRALYEACMARTRADLRAELNECARFLAECMAAITGVCMVMGFAFKACFIAAAAICVINSTECRAAAKDRYRARIAGCKADLQSCLAPYGLVAIFVED